jgi:hypothetical protein
MLTPLIYTPEEYEPPQSEKIHAEALLDRLTLYTPLAVVVKVGQFVHGAADAVVVL